MTPEQRIDVALDSVLKASGSALRHYTMPKTLADMREAMRKAMFDELPENDMKQGYYSEIATPREALYEAACAMDNQDVPLEDWPVKLIAALSRAGFAVVPVELPHDVLGRAAIAGVAETGNPKHAWDFLISATRAA